MNTKLFLLNLAEDSWEGLLEHFRVYLLKYPRHSNTGLVSSGVSLTSWGEGVSSVLVGHPSSDGVTIKIPYGVDVLLH